MKMITYRHLTCTLIAVWLLALSTHGQNVGINEDGSNPDPSAILDIKSTTKGLLVPRMTQEERETITNAAIGLLVYQTDGEEGFWLMKASGWTSLNASGGGDGGSDGDNDPLNEIQTIKKEGNTVTLSKEGGSFIDENTTYSAGAGISISEDNIISSTSGGGDGGSDGDNDPLNEIQTIKKEGNTVTLSKEGGSFIDENTTYSAGAGISISEGNVISNAAPTPWAVSGSNVSRSSGNVGIGTEDPSTKLHIEGNIRIKDGNEAGGRVLISDPTGVGSWRNATKITSVAPTGCQSAPHVTGEPTKIAELTTVVKDHAETKLDVTFQTHISGTINVGNAILYELRIDGVPATNQAGRLLYHKSLSGYFLPGTIRAVFESITAGSHTVEIWVWVSNNGDASNVMYDAGCFSGSNVTIVEFH